MVAIRTVIQRIVSAIEPFDHEERDHISFTKEWIQSGAEIFRLVKPATPDPHLVVYCILVDQAENKMLLTDHKNAKLWLPPGGHTELNELPEETAKRELFEELGIEADFIVSAPVFLTVTQTSGISVPHTDVSLWYVVKGNASDFYKYDESEFHQVRWFSIADIPYQRTDRHMTRLVKKLSLLKILK